MNLITTNVKYLITLSDWFTAADGKIYICIWGEIIASDENHVKVGRGEGSITVKQSMIICSIECKEKPFLEYGTSWDSNVDKITEHKIPTKIYIVED